MTANDNPGIFATAPAVNAGGTLTYDANAPGIANITVELRDNGGGDDTSIPFTFSITVNTPPSFTGGGDVARSDGPQTVPGWASAISAGPADESGQALTFVVTANDNPGIFNGQPTIDAGGTLSFDGRPLDGGGTDTSAPYVFTISIT